MLQEKPQRKGLYRHFTVPCVRCGTEWQRVLTLSGEPVINRYKYPDGYVRLGMGRMDRAARDILRGKMIERLLSERSHR